MQVYVKFFGRKSGALGISYYHSIHIHAESELFESVRESLYKIGYESVTVLEVSVTTDRVLTNDELLYNSSNGTIRKTI